jgi:hypothetical protein
VFGMEIKHLLQYRLIGPSKTVAEAEQNREVITEHLLQYHLINSSESIAVLLECVRRWLRSCYNTA